MSVDLLIDPGLDESSIPSAQLFADWIGRLREFLQDRRLERDICIRICDAEASRDLNQRYREKDEPTNVLSFPAGADDNLPLGDLAICWPVVLDEASCRGRKVEAHAAHLAIHGALHLLGLDHVTPEDAEEMEKIEIAVLDGLGIANPYELE